MYQMLRMVARPLPASIKHKMKMALQSLSGVPATDMRSNAAVPILHAAAAISNFPSGPLTLDQLDALIKDYDSLTLDAKRQRSCEVFDRISMYPTIAPLADTGYSIARFGAHPLYCQIRAAHKLGTGEIQSAFEILSGVEQRDPTPFNVIMAARCLMRPSGRERQLVEYLKHKAKSYPGDRLIALHLATALFCCGETHEANERLDEVKDQWLRELSVYRGEIDLLATELNRALSERIVYRHFRYDDTAYREDLIREHWEPYFYWMNCQSKHLMFGWLKRFYRDRICDLVASLGEGAEFYNFGVMCAQADAEAAERNPAVKFVGIDRQASTAELNRRAYANANLTFVAAEIEDVLRELPPIDAPRILFHARTGTLCYPDKLKRLYELCEQRGVKYIALFENYSLSHQYYRFYSFDDFPADSIVYKNDQFIHNYKRFLESAGYEIVRVDRMFSPLVSPFSEIDLCSTHAYVVGKLKGM